MLQVMEIIHVGLESFTLDGERQVIIVAIDLFSVKDRPDNLLLVLVDHFALGAINVSLSGNFAVAKVIRLTSFQACLKLDQALLSHKYVVVSEQIWHFKLLRGSNSDV